MRKLNESREIQKDRKWTASCYQTLCDTFSFLLFPKLVPYAPIDDVLKARRIILDKLF